MGFVYFSFVLLAALLAYYIWFLLFNNQNKRMFVVEENIDEPIEFEFSTPIRVSQDLILGAPQSPYESSPSPIKEDAPAHVPTHENHSSSHFPHRSKAEADSFTELANATSKVDHKGVEVVSNALSNLSLPSSARQGEIEYLSFLSVDMTQSLREGRNMFSGVFSH